MVTLYHSTRGGAPDVDIRDVTLAGLAPDGGLYIPKIWPQFGASDLAAMRGCSYQDIAFRVLKPFMQSAIPDIDLRALIGRSYASFDEPDVTHIKHLGSDFTILELFHGPTLAFKDIALQFLGNLFEYFLSTSDRRITIIGATSGDTGSAAIAALADRKNIDVFILYPAKGPSDIQRKQMTCVESTNIHALAIDGTFDDCQALVKSLFADKQMREAYNFSTVNSINLVRILAQMVYYFAAAARLDAAPSFVVPTGNFGDIYAGFAAQKCGLLMGKLILATNSNDILTRFFETGMMQPRPVLTTLSPSMDIQISSNFERLLFDLCEHDPLRLRAYMGALQANNYFEVTKEELERGRRNFLTGRADDVQTVEALAYIHDHYNYVVDPHTAVGLKVARDYQHFYDKPLVCLATAHPAKFPDTVDQAIKRRTPLPQRTALLISKAERTTLLPADIRAVSSFIKETKHEH